jgi:aspartokinase
MKFGGTSVADAVALENAARIVAAHRQHAPVVVVSAMSGVTDALLGIAAAATVYLRRPGTAARLRAAFAPVHAFLVNK